MDYAKWFETVEEAERFVQEFKTKYKISIQKRREESRDVNKGNIYWSGIGFPYLIAKTTTFNGEAITSTSSSLSSQMSSACNSSNPDLLLESFKCYSLLLSEVVTFPNFQCKKESTKYVRNLAAKTIKERMSTPGSPLITKARFRVKAFLRTDRIKPSQTKIAKSSDVIRPIKWATTLLDAMKLIEDFELSSGSKFIRWQKYSYDVGKKKHVHWDSDSNLPYAVVKKEAMECHLGKDRNKAHNERRKHMDHNGARRKRRVKSSKKVDCKALLTITEVVKFPQYEVKTQDPDLIFQAETAVQHALMTGDDNLVKRSEWLVQFPLNADHSGHVLEKAAGMLQSTDGRIGTKIHEMVTDGARNCEDVVPGVVGSLYCSEDSEANCSVASIPDDKCENISNEVRKVSENPNRMKKTVDSISNLLTEIRNVSFHVRSVDTLKETASSLESTLRMLQSHKHDSGLRLLAVSTKVSSKGKRKSTTDWDEPPRSTRP